MAVRDNVTLNNILLSDQVAISSDTTTNGTIIDSAAVEGGLSFYIASTAYTDGTYKLLLQEGEASNLSDAATVPDEKLILVTGLDAVNTGVTAVTADGAKYFKVGVFSNLRYVRANIVSTVTTSGATINVIALVSPEILAAD